MPTTNRTAHVNQAKTPAHPGRIDLATKYRFALLVLADASMSGKAKTIAAYLLEKYNDDPECRHPGWAWPSLNTIAADTKLSRRSVVKHVATLGDYFEIVRGNKVDSNLYRPRFELATLGTNTSLGTKASLGTKTGGARDDSGATLGTEPALYFHLSDTITGLPSQRASRARGEASSLHGQRKSTEQKSNPLASKRERALAAVKAYQPSAETIAWASEHCAAVTDPCGTHHVEKFKNNRLAKGKTHHDLDHAFREWLAREQEYAVERDQNNATQPRRGGNPLFRAALDMVRNHKEDET